jgi:hypothetical protein
MILCDDIKCYDRLPKPDIIYPPKQLLLRTLNRARGLKHPSLRSPNSRTGHSQSLSGVCPVITLSILFPPLVNAHYEFCSVLVTTTLELSLFLSVCQNLCLWIAELYTRIETLTRIHNHCQLNHTVLWPVWSRLCSGLSICSALIAFLPFISAHMA